MYESVPEFRVFPPSAEKANILQPKVVSPNLREVRQINAWWTYGMSSRSHKVRREDVQCSRRTRRLISNELFR